MCREEMRYEAFRTQRRCTMLCCHGERGPWGRYGLQLPQQMLTSRDAGLPLFVSLGGTLLSFFFGLNRGSANGQTSIGEGV